MVLSTGQLVSALMKIVASLLMILKLKIARNILYTTCQDNIRTKCNQDIVLILLVSKIHYSSFMMSDNCTPELAKLYFGISI